MVGVPAPASFRGLGLRVFGDFQNVYVMLGGFGVSTVKVQQLRNPGSVLL